MNVKKKLVQWITFLGKLAYIEEKTQNRLVNQKGSKTNCLITSSSSNI